MKIKRHSKILDLIQTYQIETQEELADLLSSQGVDVTQATVSRDIKELKLIKVPTEDGRSIYASVNSTNNMLSDRLIQILKSTIISVDYANNMVVIKTLTGMANAAAEALDSLEIKDVVGTIAGDNTIFTLTRSEEKAIEVIDQLKKVVQLH